MPAGGAGAAATGATPAVASGDDPPATLGKKDGYLAGGVLAIAFFAAHGRIGIFDRA